VLDGVLALSTLASNDARWSTIVRYLGKFGLQPLPPTVDKIVALAAALKAGSYRSAPTYLGVYKSVALRHGYEFSQPMSQAMRDMTRSCLRGLGGPVRARPLPLDALSSLPGGSEPWVRAGPLSPRNLIVCGSWWLMHAPHHGRNPHTRLGAADHAGSQLGFAACDSCQLVLLRYYM